MKTVNVDKLVLNGISVRTNNKNEMDISTSKIAGLWNEFFVNNLAETTKNKKNSPYIYGVYSNYESDHRGDFTVSAAVEVDQDSSSDDIMLEEGKYMVFENTGNMPSVVIETWGKIWEYFEENQDIKRSYSTDYEKYLGENKIEIYIGLE